MEPFSISDQIISIGVIAHRTDAIKAIIEDIEMSRYGDGHRTIEFQKNEHDNYIVDVGLYAGKLTEVDMDSLLDLASENEYISLQLVPPSSTQGGIHVLGIHTLNDETYYLSISDTDSNKLCHEILQSMSEKLIHVTPAIVEANTNLGIMSDEITKNAHIDLQQLSEIIRSVFSIDISADQLGESFFGQTESILPSSNVHAGIAVLDTAYKGMSVQLEVELQVGGPTNEAEISSTNRDWVLSGNFIVCPSTKNLSPDTSYEVDKPKIGFRLKSNEEKNNFGIAQDPQVIQWIQNEHTIITEALKRKMQTLRSR